MLTYLHRGDPVTAEEMNTLTAAFDGSLSGIMGGKSFALAFPGAIPARLTGKIFCFTGGVTVYAQKFAGVSTRAVTVNDPITGAPSAGTGARPYDESAIASALNAKTVTAYQDPKQIAVIGDVTSYPAGLTRVVGVGLYEHSLFPHIRINGGKRYWARESAAVFPSKRYRKAVAEIIIEGVDAATIPAGADTYRCFRVHNLQNRGAQFIIERMDGPAIIFHLAPFECRCYTRTFVGYDTVDAPRARWTDIEESPYLYFFPFIAGEEPIFWHWNSTPSNPNSPTATLAADGNVITASGSSQANNTVNPAVLYDFLYQFRENGSCYARFRRDPHELCDMAADFAHKFPCLKNTPDFPIEDKGKMRSDALVGDMFHHAGTVEVNKLNAGGNTLLARSTFEFRGYRTIAADAAAAGLATSVDGSGNLVISDPHGFVLDIFPIGTNFLKRTGYNTDGSQSADLFLGYLAWQRIPVGVNLPRTIEDRIFEADTTGFADVVGQDIRGDTPSQNQFTGLPLPGFTLRNKPSYRIYQRALQQTARAYNYTGFDGAALVLNGTPLEKIIYSGGNGSAIGGIHNARVSDLLTLKHFGDPSGTQNDAHVTYSAPVATLTPEGWVVTFTESVRGDRLPFAPTAAPSFDTLVFTIPPYAYSANPLNTYSLNLTTGRWELKHCIRFRKHGWGWTQTGKDFALHYSCVLGRLLNPDFADASSGTDGADYSLAQTFAPDGVQVLRTVLATECSARGGRFFGDAKTVDGWASYDSTLRAEYPGPFNATTGLWEGRQLIGSVSGGVTVESVSLARFPGTTNIVTPTFVPMLAEHYNAMAQAVNQLKNNIPFTRFPQIVWGQKILDFNPANGGPWLTWQTLFRAGNTPLPAPMTAIAGLNSADADATYYEQFLATIGVPLVGTVETDYPDLTTFRNQFSVSETYNSRGTITLTTSGNPTQRPDGKWQINGAIGCGSFVAGPVTQVPGTPGGAAVETMPLLGVNLQAYGAVGRKWLNAANALQLSQALGFPIHFREVVIPLALDLLQRTGDFDDSTIKPKAETTFTGVIAITDSFPDVAQLKLDSGLDANGHVAISANSFALTKQQLCFRLAEIESEAKWKIAVPNSNADVTATGYSGVSDLTAFNRRENRTFGRIRFSTGLHTSWQFHPRTVFPAGWQFDLATFNAAGEVDERYEVNIGGTVTILQSSTAGPRWFRDLKIPADQTAALSQDRLAGFLNAERRWFAAHLVTTFADFSATFASIGIPDFGLVKDWWLRDPASYMAAINHTPATQTFSPPRDIAIPAGQLSNTRANPLTILPAPDDGTARLLSV